MTSLLRGRRLSPPRSPGAARATRKISSLAAIGRVTTSAAPHRVACPIASAPDATRMTRAPPRRCAELAHESRRRRRIAIEQHDVERLDRGAELADRDIARRGDDLACPVAH